MGNNGGSPAAALSATTTGSDGHTLVLGNVREIGRDDATGKAGDLPMAHLLQRRPTPQCAGYLSPVEFKQQHHQTANLSFAA
jgi:hypothetical protein